MNEFKRKLAELCQITEWDPTEEELLLVKTKIEALSKEKDVTDTDVRAIVCGHFPDAFCFDLEGIDTRDVATLLALLLEQSLREND
ncbi:hypothetical protein AB6C98_06890 [Vibrio splendidus]